MPANYDADNPTNWEQIYNGIFAATYIQGRQIPVYNPIPKTLLSLNIDTPLIAIYCQSTDYRDTKKYLGSVYQSVIGGGSFPTSTASGRSKSIYSNETVFAEFPRFDDNYDLTLNVRWWVEHLDITIFKYVGEITLEVDENLARLESKIDRLL